MSSSDQSNPDLTRSEQQPVRYIMPTQSLPTFQGQIVEGYTGDNTRFAEQAVTLPEDGSSGQSVVFVKALLFGAVGAAVGSIAWGLFSLTHFMVGIVAIAVGWLVARAMMTATGGVGGRPYQIAAVILTYFGCSFGDVLGAILQDHGFASLSPVVLVVIGLAGPFLQLSNPINGLLGLFILFVGMRAAWRLAAGSPGFGGAQSGPRVNPFGM
jgi:hypothetical protein